MSGKSLNEIWSQMQAQRAAEQQARMAQERALYEQRERARKEYLQKMRMYEKVSLNTTTNAAAAGGSRRQIDKISELIQQSFLINWVDFETDEWKIVVYNYDTGTLSDIINTGLVYNSGSQWYRDRDDYTVHNKGFTFVLRNDDTLKYKIFFIQPDGRLVDTKDLDTNEDFQYTENAIIYLGSLDGVSTCYHYDGGAYVRTHSFPNVTINLIEVDDASNEDVTRDGTILIEAPNNGTYYLARPNGDLVDVTDYLSVVGTGNIVMDYNMTFITKLNSDNSAFKIVSQEGELVNEFDLTPYPITNSQVLLYGENSVCLKTTDWPISGNELFLSYDGDTNQFVALTFSSINIDTTTIYSSTEKSYYSPRPGSGNHLAVANYNNVTSENLGYIVENLNLWWLPKGSTSFQNYDFAANFGMTVSFIEGFSQFTGNRLFSKGQNPLVMYSAGIPNDILIGFMTPTGLATQSTGVKYASCSNIWGSYLGENSFAVFDLDSGDRLWQVYDENSIVAETTTTSNWSYGSSFGETVNRKGTLCVIDSDDTTMSFIWTEQVGLQAGPTGLGQIYNQNGFAIRDYESYSEQIITQYITGEEGS
jgi:hypothetical protein